MKQEIYQREFSISEIYIEAWGEFVRNFKLILFIVLVVYIPINILFSLVPLDVLKEYLGDKVGFRTYLKIMQWMEFLIGTIAAMAIAYVIKQRIDNKLVSFSEALKKSLSRWPAAIGTSVLATVLLIGLTLLLIIPGIIYYVYWTFMIFIVVLSDKSGMSALRYSKQIVKGRWWKVFFYLSIFGIVGSFFSYIIGSIEGSIIISLPENMAPVFEIVLDTITDLLTEYFVVVSIVFFINFDSTRKAINAI